MIKIGDRFKNTKGEVCEVVTYNGFEEVTVKFLCTGNSKVFSGSALNKGLFKNHMSPSLAGVGVLGEGIHKTKDKGKTTKTYELWRDMINRCYNENTTRYDVYGGRGVTVCEEWLNFQNFAEWCIQEPYFNKEDYQLDKDLLGKGNLYSPENCCFIPRALNSKLGKGIKTSKAKVLGVYWDEARNKYFSNCTNHKGNRVFLGYSDDVSYLHDRYMKFKINSVILYSEELYNKGEIEEKVYLRLKEPNVLKEKLDKTYT